MYSTLKCVKAKPGREGMKARQNPLEKIWNR